MENPNGVKMIRREEPEFVRFTTNTTVIGTLVRVETIKVENGKANRYTVRKQGGKMVRFLGLTAIDDALYLSDVGRLIRVHCVGEETLDVNEGKNARKIFEIDVADRVVDPTEITDEDIPF